MLLILAAVLLVGCKIENIYLTILPITRVTEITDTIYAVPYNRSTMNFQRADSMIKKASDDAMKSVILKKKNNEKKNIAK